MRTASMAVAFLLLAAPAVAQDSSVLVLELSPGARVAATESIDEGLLRISLWHQDLPVGSQVANAGVEDIITFTAVPVSQYSIRLDLRLSERVRGVDIERTTPERLEVRFTEHRSEGLAVRLKARRTATDAERAAHRRQDYAVAERLLQPHAAVDPYLRWDPITWPMGIDSPVRIPLDTDSEPHPFSTPPQEIREAWKRHKTLFDAVTLADKGEVADAIDLIRRLPNGDDRERALIALARAHIWSRPGPTGEPSHPGRAADGYLLAAGLQPDADWAPWAHGQAGYGFERERRYHEAIREYERAIKAAPEHGDRPHWEIGVGMSLIERFRRQEGIERIVETAGGLSSTSKKARFTARRVVAHALWKDGQTAAAASIVDLLLSETPEIARDPQYDHRWARMYLDAGRTAAAQPYLERLEADADAKVDRERARWWLHEVSLAHRDAKGARQWLRTLIDTTPGSVLVPMARMRLHVLDALVADGKAPDLSWEEVALALRDRALAWPYTPIEDEALSLTAQLFAHLGLVEESLRLTEWVEGRTPQEGGAIAYGEQICRLAPDAFSQMRSRGELVRALGIYREYLDRPLMHGCVDISTRTDAAATAVSAGVPDLAARWLGQAVAEGTGGMEESRNLVALSHVYLADGKVTAAQQTLGYLEQADLPRPVAIVDGAWGDVQYAQDEWVDAEESYDLAMRDASNSVRTTYLVPSLQFRRGLSRAQAGDLAGALADFRVSVPAGGADDPVVGWLRLASVGARTVGGEEALYREVLTACDHAAEADPAGGRTRAIAWYRALAHDALNEADKAAPLLAELAAEPDSWGLKARELVADSEFDSRFDEILALASEG